MGVNCQEVQGGDGLLCVSGLVWSGVPCTVVVLGSLRTEQSANRGRARRVFGRYILRKFEMGPPKYTVGEKRVGQLESSSNRNLWDGSFSIEGDCKTD